MNIIFHRRKHQPRAEKTTAFFKVQFGFTVHWRFRYITRKSNIMPTFLYHWYFVSCQSCSFALVFDLYLTRVCFSDQGCRETLPESDLLMHHVVFLGSAGQRGFGAGKAWPSQTWQCGIRSVCPKTAVQDMSAGRSFAGFIRDGKVSVLRLRCEGYNHDGKLSMIHQIILLMAFEFLGGAQITLCVCVCVCVCV